MDPFDAVAAAVQPWSQACDRAALWLAPAGDAAALGWVDEARAVLRALASREVAIPAELPAQAASPLAGWPRPANRPRAFNRVRRRRAAVLRLGVWDRLVRLHDAVRPDERAALPALQVALARGAVDVPPGLGPAPPYAGSADALRFFDAQLRGALAQLAERHDAHGAAFAPLAQAATGDDSVADLQRWSRAWSCAVSAIYLDWLVHAADGNLQQAMQLLWREQAVRFRPPSGRVALPTRERRMRLDVWADLVLAQSLQHDDARWIAAAQPWHRVRLAMHDLGERDRGSRSSDGPRTLFRGLSVEMLYQAVFVGRAQVAAAQPAPAASAAAGPAPSGSRVLIDLPVPCPGQQANFEVILRWRAASEPAGPVRFAGSDAAMLDAAQRAWIERWRQARVAHGDAACSLEPTELDWRPARARQATYVDDEGRRWAALGHAPLWRLAGADAQWVDTVVVVHRGGAWQEVPVHLRDEWIGEEARTWWMVPADAARALREAFASPARSHWAIRRAGLGRFLMAAADPERGAGGHASP